MTVFVFKMVFCLVAFDMDASSMLSNFVCSLVRLRSSGPCPCRAPWTSPTSWCFESLHRVSHALFHVIAALLITLNLDGPTLPLRLMLVKTCVFVECVFCQFPVIVVKY